jgi:hypothetical protein
MPFDFLHLHKVQKIDARGRLQVAGYLQEGLH